MTVSVEYTSQHSRFRLLLDIGDRYKSKTHYSFTLTDTSVRYIPIDGSSLLSVRDHGPI